MVRNIESKIEFDRQKQQNFMKNMTEGGKGQCYRVLNTFS